MVCYPRHGAASPTHVRCLSAPPSPTPVISQDRYVTPTLTVTCWRIDPRRPSPSPAPSRGPFLRPRAPFPRVLLPPRALLPSGPPASPDPPSSPGPFFLPKPFLPPSLLLPRAPFLSALPSSLVPTPAAPSPALFTRSLHPKRRGEGERDGG